ncbi:ATP-binding protein [Seonamhaeicola maritimus]|uniref:ATP-binding protein n=1 Tax=Seonamhaeicola maritimus TaxID=2591822 RepID=UPI00249518E1|nr:ATP-binding protein [Seonamhaeicola maritimus]
MKINFKTSLLIFLIGIFIGHSQDNLLVAPAEFDSLKQRIDNHKEFDETRVSLLNEYARLCFYNKEFKTGLMASRDARLISEKIDFKGGLIMYHLSLAAFMGGGRSYQYHNQLAEKISIEEDLSEYYQPVTTPEGYEMNKGSQERIDQLLPVLEYFKELGEQEIQALVQIIISDSYYDTEQYEANYKMLQNTIDIYKELGELFPAINLYGWMRHLLETDKVDGDLQIIHGDLMKLLSTTTDAKILANVYYQLGTYEQFTNKNISNAVEYYLMSVKYSEQLEPTSLLLDVYERMSVIYQDLGLWPKRTEYILKIIALKKEIESDPDLFHEYQRALWCMYNINRNDDARAYMDTLQTHYSNNFKNELENLNNTFEGQVLKDEEQYEKAISLLTKSYDGYVAQNNQYAPPFEAIHIADCYIKLGDYKSALKYAMISHEWHLKKPNDFRNAIEANSRLAEIYGAMGKTQKAYKHLSKYHNILKEQEVYNEASSVMELEVSTLLETSQEQINALEKEQFIKEQENKTQRLWIFSIAGALLSVVIILLIVYRNNKQKQKANTLLKKQKTEIQETLDQLKTTQTQLIQSEKMASLGELTAGIAHEIQNPLNFVNNFSEVSNELLGEMKEELTVGDKEEAINIANDVIQNLEKISYHGDRASSIVKGMLDHSRANSGMKELVDINILADEYLRLAYHGLRAKDKSFNAAMETEYDASLEKIKIVPQEIGRVLLNLISNAFYVVNKKHKSQKENYQPMVNLRTVKDKNNITISVTDNGDGIPNHIKDKIFQPFFTTKPTGEGTGLGLSLSYDIVKAHGGKLNVDTKEGKGTTFTIVLPV